MQMNPLKSRGSQCVRFFMKSNLNLNFYIPLRFHNLLKCKFIRCWVCCNTFMNEVAYTYSNFFVIINCFITLTKKYLNNEIWEFNFLCLVYRLSVNFPKKGCKYSLKYEIPSGCSKGKRTFCLFHQNVTLRITTFCYVVSRLVVCCTIKTKAT